MLIGSSVFTIGNTHSLNVSTGDQHTKGFLFKNIWPICKHNRSHLYWLEVNLNIDKLKQLNMDTYNSTPFMIDKRQNIHQFKLHFSAHVNHERFDSCSETSETLKYRQLSFKYWQCLVGL